jgi:hypothetical protein
MVKEIVLAIDPTLRRVEEILLWRNKVKTGCVFTCCNILFGLFYLFSVRTYCIMSFVGILLHLLDAYRTKKRKRLQRLQEVKPNVIENVSPLGKYILFVHSKVCSVFEKLNEFKKHNRVHYFVGMCSILVITAMLGIKVRGVYLTYSMFWIIFFVPAIIHYDMARKLLRRCVPLLEQLDQSMKYERRSILDKNDLLVDVQLPSSEAADDEIEDEYLAPFKFDENSPILLNQKLEKNEDDDNDDDDDDGSETVETDFVYR